MNIKHQQGIGLIEVMVALLLLAIAVLGFSALQMHAVAATDESLVRTRGTSIVRALSESMRNNVEYLPQMVAVINEESTFSMDCKKDVCNEEQMAQDSAKALKTRATEEGFKVSIVDCPGVASGKLYCAIIAWGNTNAIKSDKRKDDGADAINCVDESGVYYRGSTCLIMETY